MSVYRIMSFYTQTDDSMSVIVHRRNLRLILLDYISLSKATLLRNF